MKSEKVCQAHFRDVFVGYTKEEIIQTLYKIDDIKINKHKYSVPKYKDNKISTSNYNFVNFLPKSILIQFLRVYNFYFLVTTALQAVPQVTTSPIYISALPFIFVIGVSVVRELIEEIKRRRSDSIVNNSKSLVLRDSKFVETKWSKIKVGDTVLVHEGEQIPADLLLLQCSDSYGTAYIQTLTLDGERALKPRQSFTEILENMRSKSVRLQDMKIHLKCEIPNNKIYQFEGQLNMQNPPIESKKTNLSQFLLRGSVLANTDWIIGMVVYAGHDTKIIRNLGKRKYKQTHIEKTLNIICIFLVVFQTILCLLVAILSANYTVNNAVHFSNGAYQGATYLFKNPDDTTSFYEQGIYGFITFFLLLSTIIPISLLVSIEIIKIIQGLFIIADTQMYSVASDQKCKVMTFSLNEELGLITDIFTDKTGTLTTNEMVFKACTVAMIKYDKKSVRKFEQQKDSASSEEDKSISNANINQNFRDFEITDDYILKYMGRLIRENDENFPYNQYLIGNIRISKQIDFLYYFWLAVCCCHEVISISKFKQKVQREHFDDMFLLNGEHNNKSWKSLKLKKKNTFDQKVPRKISINNDNNIDDFDLGHRNKILSSQDSRENSEENKDNLKNDNFKISEQEINEDDELVYHGMSPDEITLVNSAKAVGFEFRYRSNNKIEVKVMGQRKVFNLLKVFPFTSDRKRMTVVVQDPDDPEYVVSFTKGADNVMKSLSLEDLSSHFDFASIDKFAKKGFRTLLVGMKVIRFSEFVEWDNVYNEVNKEVGVGEQAIKELEELTSLIERDLFLLGTTALEDKLQDNVHECIEEFRRADIKVWMITGDKLETAENIGISCRLLQDDADRFIFSINDDKQATNYAK